MTQNAAQKRAVRDLAEREGIPYSEARRRIVQSTGTFLASLFPDARQSSNVLADLRGAAHPTVERGSVFSADYQFEVDEASADDYLAVCLTQPDGHVHTLGGVTGLTEEQAAVRLMVIVFHAILGTAVECRACEKGEECSCIHGIRMDRDLLSAFYAEKVKSPRRWKMSAYDIEAWLYSKAFCISRETREDLSQPYDLYVLPDGTVLQQDVWKGKIERVIGAVDEEGPRNLVSLRDLLKTGSQEAMIGKTLLVTDRGGEWSTIGPKVQDVQPRGK